jgi:hypothetical protein
MNKLLVGAAAAALVVGLAPAVAQTPPPGVAQGTAPAPMATQRMHMRVMSDRTMTRDEVANHVGKLFAKLDTNHDGFITKDEVDAMHHKMGEMHADIEKRMGDHGVMMGDRGAIFDRLDANKDGNISRQEFLASRPETREERVIIMRDGGADRAAGGPGMMRMHGASMGFGGHLFAMADANKDGRVSLAEAQAAALAHFDRADLNHDGKITPDERQQAHQMMREHRPS